MASNSNCSDMKSLQTFHQFAHLPSELRLKVWDLSIEPQVVEIWAVIHHVPGTCDLDNSTNDFPCGKSRSTCTHDQYEHIFTLPTERIPILEICSESRALALERDIISISTDSSLQGGVENWCCRNFEHKQGSGKVAFEAKMKDPRPEAMVDLRNDIIYLRNFHGLDSTIPYQPDISLSHLSVFVARFGQNRLERIRFLALSSSQWNKFDVAKGLLKSLLCFTNLKELTVTFVPENARSPDSVEDIALFEVEFLEQTIADDLENLKAENPGWTIPNWKVVMDRWDLEGEIEGRPHQKYRLNEFSQVFC